MMNFRAMLAIVTVAMAGLTAPEVKAAPTSSSACICVAAFIPGGPAGTVDVARGSVAMAGAKGFVPISAGTKLPPNAQLRTGPFSSADVLIGGGCHMSLGPNSLASLATTTRGVCARKIEDSRVAAGTSDPVGGFLLGADATNALFVVGLGLRHSVSH